MARRLPPTPDPTLGILAEQLRCAPQLDAVIAAVAALQRPQIALTLEQVEEAAYRGVRRHAEEQWIGDEQVAERLGCHVRTWRRRVKVSPALQALGRPIPGRAGRPAWEWQIGRLRDFFKVGQR